MTTGLSQRRNTVQPCVSIKSVGYWNRLLFFLNYYYFGVAEWSWLKNSLIITLIGQHVWLCVTWLGHIMVTDSVRQLQVGQCQQHFSHFQIIGCFHVWINRLCVFKSHTVPWGMNKVFWIEFKYVCNEKKVLLLYYINYFYNCYFKWQLKSLAFLKDKWCQS